MSDKFRFTDIRIDKIPYPVTGQTLYRDSETTGFGLRVGLKSKSFFCERKVNGKAVRVTIGKYPTISLSDAKRAAQKELSSMTFGVDPREKKMNQKVSKITLQEVMDEFLNSRTLTVKTRKGYENIMKAVYGDWINRPIASINKDMIEKRHKELSDKEAYANRAARTIRSVINFAIAKYELSDGTSILSVNPVTRLSETKQWNRSKRKQGHLKAHHLKAWFNEVNKIQNDAIRDFMKFTLYTGVRRTEAASLEWANVSMENKSFVIKSDVSKNHIAVEIPISHQLFEILKQRKFVATTPFVFPSRTSASGHLEEPKKPVIEVGKAIGYHFTIHDLRRTFITFADSLDISHYAVKALVNHKLSPNDVTGGYIMMNVDRLRKPVQDIADLIEYHAGGE